MSSARPSLAKPMSEETAAWVREHAWTAGMRKLFGAVPGHYLKCACQSGIAYRCQEGQRSQCARGESLRQPETAVHLRDGMRPAIGTSAVWIADRVCVWRCKCDCHEQPVERIDKPVQLELFDALTA